MACRAKSYLDSIPPPVHGGMAYLDPHFRPETGGNILDFSTCCNPYGPPPHAYSALTNADITSYPDGESKALVKVLAARLSVSAEELIVTAGSTELIRLAALAYFGQGDTVVIISPTYSEYDLACRICGAQVKEYLVSAKSDFSLDTHSLVEFARNNHAAGVFLCNPNNPTGQYLSLPDINKVVASFPDIPVILDEAYIAFTRGAWDSLPLLTAGNLLIVRSLTKDYALAGLRLGYGVASRNIISDLKKVRPPWNVSSPAQLAGLASLTSNGHMKRCQGLIAAGKSYLLDKLRAIGYQVVPSSTNFFLVEVGNASLFKKNLLAYDCLVRDCTSFGLPGHVRIAPRSLPDCRKLIRAIKEMPGGLR